jgi:tetratricopeptide (TPR) repeat protein/DNA-binding CsgD family transcriptional regulator
MKKIILLILSLPLCSYYVVAQVENGKSKVQIGTSSPIKDSLLHLLSSATDTNRVILLNKLSYQSLINSSFTEALSFGKEAFDLSEKLNYKKGKAKSLINQGNAFAKQAQFEEAKEYYLNAHFLAKEIGDDLILSHSVNNLGEVYRELGDYPIALSYFMEGLKLDEKAQDKEGQAGTLNNIGLVQKAMKNRKKAIEFYERSLKLSQEIKNDYYVSISLLNLADLYSQEHDPEKALRMYEESLKIKREINDPYGMSSCFMGIGNIYLEKNNFDLALSYYLQSLNLGKINNHKSIIGSSLNNIGNIYSKLNQHQKALSYHRDFLALALETKAKSDQSDAYENISLDYANLKDYKNAFEFQQRNAQLRDSIFSLENSHLVAEMDAKYKSEKKELEIEALKKEHALQQTVNQHQKIIFGGVVAIVLMAGSLFYFRSQVSKQKNIRLTEKIDAQNRELSTVALLVTKKNQAFSDLKTKLTAILRKDSTESISDIKSIVKEIDGEIDFDVEWDTFKYHFEKVHPDFFAKLKQAAPDLSDRELRFCAYLKSNLSTKEIARFTSTTVRSVQQTKYRINQKLSGQSEGNLSDYIQEL